MHFALQYIGFGSCGSALDLFVLRRSGGAGADPNTIRCVNPLAPPIRAWFASVAIVANAGRSFFFNDPQLS
jgi:hypothetical protein